VNIKTENRTALQVASHEGHNDVVVLLLNAGADPKIQDEDGDSAFHYAAYGCVLTPDSQSPDCLRECVLAFSLASSTTGISVGLAPTVGYPNHFGWAWQAHFVTRLNVFCFTR